ncbi:DNA invertase Pin-like site-specific DNA recombinase [Bacillus thermophilus]|uniref:DNA invertase Pin-like site-specific DNA recombinase n=1 Tax=Siminovitchia thermophila TaxID=1245522 RepID=A0ABS2R290_9BACI|nr:recombinase family protein [Siminovitchia thermophila]MBM7713038.1 DNA invertase Pin-like site-specific DNA recombinase [Siminovitchia thermophila]
MKIGYARVSTVGQDLETQEAILKAEGCERLYVEKVTGTSTAPRKELANMIDNVRAGDTVYVTKIDRLARSITDLNKIVSELNEKGVSVVFIQDDMTFKTGGKITAMQELMFNILGSFAQFERSLIVERTTEGRERAKAQGKHMGRPASSNERDIRKAIELMKDRANNGLSVTDICKITGVKRATLYARMKEEKAAEK